jgi:predicted heme/steroid binding protein
MLKRIILTSILLFVFILSACAGGTNETDQNNNNNNNDDDLIVFTLTTLAENDGIDGRPAYIAVDGYVYDVSNSPHWQGGTHYSGSQAGQDLSESILQSPHGKSVLNNIPRIGILVDEDE